MSGTENRELKLSLKRRYNSVTCCGMTKKSQQVIPNLRGGWSVKFYGSSRAIKAFKTQAEAVVWARARSKKNGFGLVIFCRDGTVRSRHYV